MKLTVLSTKSFRIAGLGFALAVLAGSVWAQEQSAMQKDWAAPARYDIFDLGVAGGTPGQPYVIRNDGLISGAAAAPDGSRMHAVLWYKGRKLDIGTPGLEGPNSTAFGGKELGQAV